MLNDSDVFVWPAEFACTIIDENIILPNHYNLKIYIEPYIPITETFGIGFEKLKHVIFNVLSNSIIINQNNPISASLTSVANNVVHLPTEPYDYYLGTILFSKFVSVTEKYFDIYQITIDSAVGDRVQYSINEMHDFQEKFSGEHWWTQDNPDVTGKRKVNWEGLPIDDMPKFSPKIIKGGKSED